MSFPMYLFSYAVNTEVVVFVVLVDVVESVVLVVVVLLDVYVDVVSL